MSLNSSVYHQQVRTSSSLWDPLLVHQDPRAISTGAVTIDNRREMASPLSFYCSLRPDELAAAGVQDKGASVYLLAVGDNNDENCPRHA